jgi:hypothetical protein
MYFFRKSTKKRASASSQTPLKIKTTVCKSERSKTLLNFLSQIPCLGPKFNGHIAQRRTELFQWPRALCDWLYEKYKVTLIYFG